MEYPFLLGCLAAFLTGGLAEKLCSSASPAAILPRSLLQARLQGGRETGLQDADSLYEMHIEYPVEVDSEEDSSYGGERDAAEDSVYGEERGASEEDSTYVKRDDNEEDDDKLDGSVDDGPKREEVQCGKCSNGCAFQGECFSTNPETGSAATPWECRERGGMWEGFACPDEENMFDPDTCERCLNGCVVEGACIQNMSQGNCTAFSGGWEGLLCCQDCSTGCVVDNQCYRSRDASDERCKKHGGVFGGMACQLGREPEVHEGPGNHSLIISGFKCDNGHNEDVNQEYIYQGRTADGRPYYRGSTSTHRWLYFDERCADDSQSPRWLLNSHGMPDPKRMQNLNQDDDPGCNNDLSIVSSSNFMPTGVVGLSWQWCGSLETSSWQGAYINVTLKPNDKEDEKAGRVKLRGSGKGRRKTKRRKRSKRSK